MSLLKKNKTFGKIIIFICIIFVLNTYKLSAQEKIKIGLIVPLSGENSLIGEKIIKSARLAINKINDNRNSINDLSKDPSTDGSYYLNIIN